MNLSVIICSYNRRDTLCEVVKSVLNADWTGIEKEVIVVLDHCVDGSRKELEYRFGTKNLKVLRLDGYRRGQPAAFNYGIENSKFNNVYLADDDRIFERDYFQKICPHIKPGQLCSGNIDNIKVLEKEYLTRADIITGFYGLTKQDCYIVGGFDENMGTKWGLVDIDFARRLDMLGVRFKYIPTAIIKDLDVPYGYNPKTRETKDKELIQNELYLDFKYLNLWDDIFHCPIEECGNEVYPNKTWFETEKYKDYKFLNM